MKKFFEKIKNFFVELRKKPESERQKWLWVFVSLSVIVVFVFWLALFKNNVQIAEVNPTPTPTAVASDNSSGFLHTLYVGWQKTSIFVVEKVKAIGGAIGNFLAGIFSYSFQGWKKVAIVFNKANSYLENEFSAYFNVLGSLISGVL
jgi:hypothetical protein